MKLAHVSSEWRWQLVASSVAAALAFGGAHVADRLSAPGACRPAAAYHSPEPSALVEGGEAASFLLSMVANVGGDTRAAAFPPMAVPGYRRLETGQRGSWEVAVLQLTGRARTLEVDYGDGRPSTLSVPPGPGACVFKVSRRFFEAGQRVLRLTVADRRSTTNASGSSEREWPKSEAVVDVVARQS